MCGAAGGGVEAAAAAAANARVSLRCLPCRSFSLCTFTSPPPSPFPFQERRWSKLAGCCQGPPFPLLPSSPYFHLTSVATHPKDVAERKLYLKTEMYYCSFLLAAATICLEDETFIYREIIPPFPMIPLHSPPLVCLCHVSLLSTQLLSGGCERGPELLLLLMLMLLLPLLFDGRTKRSKGSVSTPSPSARPSLLVST